MIEPKRRRATKPTIQARTTDEGDPVLEARHLPLLALVGLVAVGILVLLADRLPACPA